ncbi:MAG TPA: endolytic transglycosylase MltG [Candidatus Krumholzibacteria bacterium]|nr:endolytic transglycosylase MltG [Candidatus Krumholzibacteria bacterium]
MTKARWLIAFFAFIVLSVAAVGAFVLYDVSHGVKQGGGEKVRVTVAEGAPFTRIVDDLAKDHLIRRAWPLKFFAQATQSDRKVHRGTYEFARGTAPIDMLRAFVNGDILTVRVTIPEGFNMWQVSAAFTPAGVDSLAMMKAIHDSDLVKALQVPTDNVEGYLAPDTYLVAFGSDAGDIVAQMLTRFHAVWTPDFESRARELGMTRHQVLTLASIVESEARDPMERPLVSAVYHNRLKINMKLDADPTVAYAKGGFHGHLYYKDLELDSPYNTYRHPGLPPGPIGNPGTESIRAALFPDTTSHALYFVARGDGRHDFSNTLKEHDAAIRRAHAAMNSRPK